MAASDGMRRAVRNTIAPDGKDLNKWLAMWAGVAVVAGLLYGAVWLVQRADSGGTELTVSVVVRDDFATSVLRDAHNIAEPDQGSSCRGDLGPGVGEGDRVIIEDGDGAVVATATLGEGTWWALTPPYGCALPFTIEVRRASFYRFDIAGRSGPTMSWEELSAQGFQVMLTVD